MIMIIMLNLVLMEKDGKNCFSPKHIKGMLINVLGKCLIYDFRLVRQPFDFLYN